MTPAERQYRRVLRLLPAGYRQLWEEDMVGAYMDSVADSPRRSVGEWFSVGWLALRLRLNGSHATPRAQLWYRMVLGIAMLATLYESLNATVSFAYSVVDTNRGFLDRSWPIHVAYRSALVLVWVATFICLVLGRLGAARVLVLVALAHELGLTSLVLAHTLNPGLSGGLPPFGASITHEAALCLTAVSVFLIPRDFRLSRGWLGAYVVPAAVVVPMAVAQQPASGLAPPFWVLQFQLLNVSALLHVGVIVGMVVALVRARQWLLPLAAFGGGVAAVQLLSYGYGRDSGFGVREQGDLLWTWVNVVQLVLAVACAVAGFLALRGAGSGASPSEVDPTRQ
jgi:hypothetical protein